MWRAETLKSPNKEITRSIMLIHRADGCRGKAAAGAARARPARRGRIFSRDAFPKLAAMHNITAQQTRGNRCQME
jgi:hypothetical protein